jgi:hypothetical protein
MSSTMRTPTLQPVPEAVPSTNGTGGGGGGGGGVVHHASSVDAASRRSKVSFLNVNRLFFMAVRLSLKSITAFLPSFGLVLPVWLNYSATFIINQI